MEKLYKIVLQQINSINEYMVLNLQHLQNIHFQNKKKKLEIKNRLESILLDILIITDGNK